MTLRRWWFQIGSSSALSIWSWVITLPMALSLSLAFDEDATDLERLAWTGYVIVIQLLIGGAMWVAAKTILPTEPDRSRPVVAVLTFTALGAFRAVTMEMGAPLFSASDSSIPARLAVNVIGGPLVLAVIAIVVDSYRRHATVMRRLREAEASLQAVRAAADEARALDEKEMASRVFAEISDAFASLDADPDDLGAMARDLVRKRSHEIAREQFAPIPTSSAPEEPRESVRSISRRMSPPPPWSAAALIELLALPLVVASHGLLAAVVNAGIALVVIAGILTAGSAAWNWLPGALRGGVGVIILGLVAGIGATTLVVPMIRLVSPDYPLYVIGGTALVVVVIVGVSVVRAVGSTLRLNEERQAQLVAESARQVHDLRLQTSRRRRRVAEFLHGPIQAELLVAATTGLPMSQVMESLEIRFAEFGRETNEGSAAERLGAVIAAWSTALEITTDVSEEALKQVDEHPGSAQLLVNALSEGLANALRHGSGLHAEVKVWCSGEDVELRVRSSGAVSSNVSDDGIGLLHLKESARSVDLIPHEHSTELVVRL